jgi:molecular chaperone DnaK
MANRSLIIANQHYSDPDYAELPGAAQDAAQLEAVLADPAIAGFEVEVLRDAPAAQCRKAIERFFRSARRDDLLLLHMSCHGQKDLQNRLYLIGSDTEKTYLASTGIDSTFISDQIEASRSSKTVLLLDCCYSGAFARGLCTRAAADSVDISEPFSGRGRVVITASTSLQFSHESESSSRITTEPSVFTSAVVHGLRSGAADLDGDGWISIDDLYNYVHDSVKRRTPNQTPTRSVASVQGALYIARNVAVRTKHVPSDIRTALRSEQPWQRIGALHELENLLGSWRSEVRDAARLDLAALITSDPDPVVAKRARDLWVSRGLGELPDTATTGGQSGATPSRPHTRHSIGIDFGTTNSAIAVWLDNECRVIPSRLGERTMPSVAAITVDGNWLIGEPAKRQATRNPQRTFSTVKLALGSNWQRRVDGRTYTAVGVAAVILAELRKAAELFLDTPVRDAVVTVPAHFDLIQRAATVEAAALAGFSVSRMINEPTAAALAYGARKDTEETLLVFDLGGGTLDVSLLEIGEGVVEVRATGGDDRLGGVNWDNRIVEYAVEAFRAEHRIDLSLDPRAMERIREAAEQAKIELSSRTGAEITLPSICAGPGGQLDLELFLTRQQFEEITRDLLDRCRAPIHRALSDSFITAEAIDNVALVGGATRMPAIADLVRELTGRPPRREVIPEGVVVGATLQSGVLWGHQKDILLLDVFPRSIGVAAANGRMIRLLERNTTTPTKRKDVVLTTATDDQRGVQIQLHQGESRLAGRNRKLGILELSGLRASPKGTPRIEVEIDVDANHLVRLTATDLDSGRSVTMQVSAETAAEHESAILDPAQTVHAVPGERKDADIDP